MLKQSSQTRLTTKGDDEVDLVDDMPVGSRANLLALIESILESDRDPRCRMSDHVAPADLVSEEGGRARFQLRAHDIRFPVRTMLSLGRNTVRGATRAQLIDAVEAANRWQPGEWRVVAATHSEAFRHFWTRQPSGLSASDRDAMFAKPPEQESISMQLTKPVQARDPVLIVHLALAEVSRQDPQQGQKNQKASAWDTFVRTGGLIQHMPFKGRQTREAAVRIICDVNEMDESDLLSPLSEEMAARVHELRGYGLSDEEIAGAIRVNPGQVAQVERLEGEDA